MPIIPLNTAREMIQRYQNNRSTMLTNRFSADVLVMSELFDKSDIETLIDQDGCTGVRIYIGMDSNLNLRIILVGVDDKQEDMVAGMLPVIVEEGQRCPPFCPSTCLGE